MMDSDIWREIGLVCFIGIVALVLGTFATLGVVTIAWIVDMYYSWLFITGD